MGKINIRIFLRHLRCRLHVTPAGRKDNVTALVDTFLNRLLCRILIGIWDIDFPHNLIVGKSEVLLHSLNSQIMRVRVSASFCRV